VELVCFLKEASAQSTLGTATRESGELLYGAKDDLRWPSNSQRAVAWSRPDSGSGTLSGCVRRTLACSTSALGAVT